MGLLRLLLQATQLAGVKAVMCWVLLTALDHMLQEREKLKRELASQPYNNARVPELVPGEAAARVAQPSGGHAL